MAMVIEDAMGNSGHIQSSTSTSQVFSNARTALVALLCLLVGFLLGSTCHGELVFEDKERGTRSEWHSARTLEHVHQRRLGQNRNLQHKTASSGDLSRAHRCSTTPVRAATKAVSERKSLGRVVPSLAKVAV
eukprot:5963536-Pleurochrysis_carterae.AAC.9